MAASNCYFHRSLSQLFSTLINKMVKNARPNVPERKLIFRQSRTKRYLVCYHWKPVITSQEPTGNITVVLLDFTCFLHIISPKWIQNTSILHDQSHHCFCSPWAHLPPIPLPSSKLFFGGPRLGQFLLARHFITATNWTMATFAQLLTPISGQGFLSLPEKKVFYFFLASCQRAVAAQSPLS